MLKNTPFAKSSTSSLLPPPLPPSRYKLAPTSKPNPLPTTPTTSLSTTPTIGDVSSSSFSKPLAKKPPSKQSNKGKEKEIEVDEVLVEKDSNRQSNKEARELAKTKKNAELKLKKKEYKLKEQKCIYRHFNYVYYHGAERGKIERQIYYMQVVLEPHDEDKESITLTEGSQVQDFNSEQWHSIVLIYFSNNGSHC